MPDEIGFERLTRGDLPLRAKRAYGRAGFRYVKTVWLESEKGYEYVMRRDRGDDG